MGVRQTLSLLVLSVKFGRFVISGRRAALERKQNGAGRPQSYATIKDLEVVSPRDNQTET